MKIEDIDSEFKRVKNLFRKIKKELPKKLHVNEAHVFDLLEDARHSNHDLELKSIILMLSCLQGALINHLAIRTDLPDIVYNSDAVSLKKTTNIYTLNNEIKESLYHSYGEITLDIQKKIKQLDEEVYLCFQIVPCRSTFDKSHGFFVINIMASFLADNLLLGDIANKIKSHYREIYLNCDMYYIKIGKIEECHTLHEEEGVLMLDILINYDAELKP